MDLVNEFAKNNQRPLSQTFHITNAILVIGILAFFAVPYLNIQVVHSFLLSNPIGTLISERQSLDWWVFAVSVSRIIVPIVGLWLLIRPEDSAGPEIIHVLLVSAVTIIDIAIAIKLSFDLANCNSADDPTNFCNDPLYCCVFFSDPTNLCPNFPNPCIPPVPASDLKVNPDFWIIYFATWAFALLEFIAVIIAAMLWSSTKYLNLQREYTRNFERDQERGLTSPYVPNAGFRDIGSGIIGGRLRIPIDLKPTQ